MSSRTASTTDLQLVVVGVRLRRRLRLLRVRREGREGAFAAGVAGSIVSSADPGMETCGGRVFRSETRPEPAGWLFGSFAASSSSDARELPAVTDGVENSFVGNSRPVDLHGGDAFPGRVVRGGALAGRQRFDDGPGAGTVDFQFRVSCREDRFALFAVLGAEVRRAALMKRDRARLAGAPALTGTPPTAGRPPLGDGRCPGGVFALRFWHSGGVSTR